MLSGLADIEAAALTIAGGVPGPAMHATAAAVGLSALLLASATAFTAMKIAGCACPPWAGVQGRSLPWPTQRPGRAQMTGLASGR